LRRIDNISAQDKLDVLISLLDASAYTYIRECTSHQEDIDCLENNYVKPVNEVYARHKLSTCRQKSEEKIEEFFQRLKFLSTDCNFAAVTAVQNRDAVIRDAFVAGLRSGYIRQRLLEENVRELQAAFDKARTLDEEAQRNCEEYRLSADSISVHSVYSAAACNTSEENSVPAECVSMETKCYFCGNKRHPRFKCPARDHVCYKCKKKGHFSSVCLSEYKNPAPTAALTCQQPSLSAASPVNSDDDKVDVLL